MLNTIIKRAPLAFLVLWYFTGVLLNSFCPIGTIYWLSACLVLIVFGFIFINSKYSIVLISVLMIAMGGLNHGMKNYKNINHISRFTGDTERDVAGIVESSENYPDGRVKIILKKPEIWTENRLQCQGKVLLRLKHNSRRYFYGDTVIFRGILREPSPKRNPREFDYQRYLANHHIYALVYLEENQVRVKPPVRIFSVRRIANNFKYKVQNLIQDSMHGESAAILQALLIGVRGEISDETEQAFIDSGVIHVLAVSGLHVGYVTLAIWIITGFFRIPLKPRVLATILGLIFYTLAVDVKPSVLRAVIMASMVLLSKGWEKQVNVYNSLAAAAFIQTLIDPMQLFDMGFQLSFMAVFSIVYIYRRLEEMLPEKIKTSVYSNSVIRYIFQLFLVSLAALIGTIPLTIYYFNRIPVISLVANLFIIPLIGVIGALGFAQVILGSVWSWFNIAYGEVETLLILLLREIVSFFSELPIAYIPVAQIPDIILILLYIFIFLSLNADKVKIRKILIFYLLIVGNVFIWKSIIFKKPLEVTFLDVGQGDATFIRLPDRRSILIDTGDRTFHRDYGELVIVPYLKRKGIRELDVLILTHPHGDHIGGAPVVIKNIDVGQIWESSIKAESKIYKEIHYLADSLDIPINFPQAGDFVPLSEDIKLYFLHPSDKFLENHKRNYNDGSLVCKLVYGKTEFLLTGDAEKESEEYLYFWDGFLESTVIKVPHHGSNTSSTDSYVDLIKPEYAVISVGQNNKFKHPAKSTMNRYLEQGAVLFRTDINHAIVFHSDGTIVKVVDWK